MSTGPRYTLALIELLDRLARTQDDVLAAVATRWADTIEAGGLVHLFGSGHSAIPAIEAFPRYGSYVGLHPLTDPRLMWHTVLGPGGIRELLWLERTEGYVETLLSHEPLNSGDVLVAYSHGGTNAAAIDAVLYAKERELYTVGVTSAANAGRPPAHSSGQTLATVCDVTIDTGAPAQDAVVEVDGWGAPVGGSSTVLACVVTHELITRAAGMLAARGHVLPTFVSPAVPGAAAGSHDEVFAAHRQRLHRAEGKAIGR